MTERNTRHPVKHFFIKKSVQFKIIAQIFITVLITAAITTGILMIIYNSKSHGGSFYYMSNDVMQDLELKSILGIVLPAVIVAEVIAVFIALGVGLFSSRKIAVPLYKIENWVSRLKNGKLNTTLAFREEDDMKELTNQCNSMAESYRKIFAEIHEHAENIALKANDSSSVIEQINKIKRILDRIEM